MPPQMAPPGGGVRLNGVEPKQVLLGGVALKDLVRRASLVARNHPLSPANRKAAILEGRLDSAAPPLPWVELPDSRLKEKLKRVLPALKPETEILIPVPPPPIEVVELDGEVDNVDELRVVLATLRALQPFKVTTLSLRNCCCFNASSEGKRGNTTLLPSLLQPPSTPSASSITAPSSADIAVKLLSDFLSEQFFNAPLPTSVDKRPVHVCVEVLYVSGSVESPEHLAILDAAWKKSGHLHSLPPVPPLPLTFRRKPLSYRPQKPERLAAMPKWAAQSLDSKPKGKKGKKGQGKKKKK